jgi:hypothetical protein
VLPLGVTPSGNGIDGETRRARNAPGFIDATLIMEGSTYMSQSSDYWNDSQDVTRFVGFSQEEAGEQQKRLLLVGIHATKKRLMGQWDRWVVLMPDPASTPACEFYPIPLYSAEEVSVVIRSSYALCISPAHKAVSRKVEAQLIGQYHFFDEVC